MPNKTALVFDSKTWTWSQLEAAVDTAAAALQPRLHNSPQQVIALLIPNSASFIISYLAVVKLGHIALPVDVTFKKLEVDFVVQASKPSLVIATNDAANLIDGDFVLDSDLLGAKTSPIKPRYILPPQRQIATLFLSSGTTGAPKAIPNTHANQLWDIKAISKPFGWTGDDTVLITLHLGHRHGLVICFLGALYHGNTMYLESRFEAGRTLELLASGKISFYSTVPAAYEKLVEFSPDSTFDLSPVRLFASSSSALPPYLAQAFKDRFGHEILDRYGTSETGSISIRNSAQPTKPGRILEDVKVRLEPNGDVAVKSPGVFPGYLNNPEATKKSLAKGGWWLTGDIGQIERGGLLLRGRAKERIQKSGYSIYPQDVEWALLNSPGVNEVKIISRSQPKHLDDEVFAFFSGKISEAELEEYSRLNLPRSWRPDVFVKIDKIPKTANGKASIAKLKQLLAELNHTKNKG